MAGMSRLPQTGGAIHFHVKSEWLLGLTYVPIMEVVSGVKVSWVIPKHLALHRFPTTLIG